MANSVDFRADQLQVNKIVVTGSNAGSTEAVLIYGVTNQGTPVNEGYINPTKFNTGSIGSDVFFYVSGGIGGTNISGGAISVFGGDLYVSGNLNVAGGLTAPQLNVTASNALTASLVSGSVIALTPITGTISQTLGGLPFINAGQNILVNYYESTGQWGITASLSGAGVTPGGSSGQIQWNNASNFGGVPNLTYNEFTGLLQGTGSFSGSFQGTLDGTASYAISSSFASNAANADFATSASFATNALTASFANNATSASFAGNSLSASFAISASYSINSLSASYASNSLSASYAANALSSSYADNALSSSFATTASFASNAATLNGESLSAFPRLAIDNTFTGNNTFTTVTASAISSSGDLTVGGNVVANAGLTGSIHQTANGNDFIIPGENIVTTYNSLGQWEISASAAGTTGQLQFNSGSKFVADSNLTYDVASATLTTVTGVFDRGVMRVAEIYPVDGDPGTPPHQTSLLFTSGATSDLYIRHFYPPSGGNTTNFRWVENSLGTGLLAGGVLSTETGTTTFSVTAGSALILSYNATTSSEPDAIIRRIEWSDFVSQSLTYIGSAPQTFVGIAPNGALIQQVQPFANTDFHDFIPLGRVLHLEGGTTYGVNETPRVSYGQSTWNGDFARSFGPLKISGHVLQASGSTLSLVKTGGSSFVEGKNYYVDPNNPNLVLPSSDGNVTISKIYREYVSGSDSSAVVIDTNSVAGYTTIDPTQFNPDNAGTLTTVSASQFTIQRVFWSPNSATGAFLVYYGPQQYNTIQEAQVAIPSEIFIEGSNTLGTCILVANIIVRQDCTDLTDAGKARIVQGGLFRGSGTGIGGAAGATLPGGLNTYIQFNDGGSTFGGSPNLTFDKTTNTFTTPNINTQVISASNAITSSGNLFVGGNTILNTLTASFLSVSNNTVLNTVTASNLSITGNFTSTGPVIASGGLSGSLQNLADGSPYLVAGPNITVNTASSGQVSITGSIGGINTQIQYNNNGLFGGVSTLTYDGSTLQGTGSFSGSFQGRLDGTASYADNAGNANTVGGQSLSGLAQLNVANTFTQNNVFTTATGSFSGSYQGNITGTASYAGNAGNANLLDGLHSYQYAQLAANNTFAGNNIFQFGLSGSLQRLSDGSLYLVAGPNVVINTASNGQISVSASTGGSNTQIQYNNNGVFGGVPTLTYNGTTLQVTGSFSGSLAGTASYATNSGLLNGLADSAYAKLGSTNTFTGNNVFTTATGSFSGSYQGNLTGTASFASNSGLLNGLSDTAFAKLGSTNTFIGNNVFSDGFSGSLQRLSNGAAYLAAGPNITINTASNGQISVTGSIGGTNTQIQYNNNGLLGGVSSLTYNGTTLQATGSFSGSLTGTASYASNAGLLNNFADTAFAKLASANTFTANNTFTTVTASAVSSSGNIFAQGNLAVQGTTQLTGAVNLANTLSASGQISTAGNLLVQGTTQHTGAVYVGGQLTASTGLNLTGASTFAAGSNFTFNGNGIFTNGLSGSLQKLSDGTTNYLLAGPNIVLTTQSNGQIAITAAGVAPGAGGTNTQFQYNNLGALAGTSLLTYNGTTLQASGSFSGSFQGTFPSNIPLYSTATANTIAFAFGTPAGTPAVQTTNASYVKIGTLVTIFFSITFAATGGIGTGNVTLINLPFTSKTQTGGAGTFMPAYFTNMNTSGADKVTTMTGLMRSNSTTIDMYGIQSAGTETLLQGGAILNNTTIAGTVTYFSAT